MTKLQGTIAVCPDCGSNYLVVRGGRSSGCPVCAERTPEMKVRDAGRAAVREVGRIRSRSIRRDTSWSYTPRLLWRCRFAIPFEVAAVSKNRSHVVSTRTRYDASGRAKVVPIRVPSNANSAARSAIAEAAQWTLMEQGIKVVQAKLWVDILVQKLDLRSDAANVVDTVFDGLKLGVGLDDNWYGLKLLDWEVVKETPQIIIGIGQETEVDHDTCLACGGIFPSATLRSHGGIARVCPVCSTGSRGV